MVEFLRATAADRDALLDFGNMVFSMGSQPHDFRALIPKFYAEGKPTEEKTFLAKENGCIRGMISVCERPIRIAGETLKVGQVGTVSAHPYARGKGYMSHLLTMLTEDAVASGTDFMALGGRRQRYGNYGFEPGATTVRFHLDRVNIHHCFADLDDSAITISEITDNADPRLDTAFALYDKQKISGMRTRENFLETAQTWCSHLFAIEENGDMIGYLIADGMEIVLADEGKLPLALKAYDRFKGGMSVAIPCAPHEQQRISFLSDICEDFAIVAAHRVNVLRFQKLADALMKLKASFTRLPDGRFVLDITGCERLLFTVQNGVPSVRATDEMPDLTLSKRHAEMLMLMPSSYVLPAPGVLKNWLPLPLFIPTADMF